MKNREEIAQALADAGYIADGELATTVALMQLLKRALLLEGEAGVGKTSVAQALASVHATELIRLQCYEGLDQSAALYEWNYQRQLLAIQAHRGKDAAEIEDQIFSEKYLLERPLLAAIRQPKPPLPLPLYRLSRRRSRGPHHHGADQRRRRLAVAPDRAHGRKYPQGGASQGTRCRRDAGLGGRAGRARRPRSPGVAGSRP